MSLANNYGDFKREIELIIKQNPSEFELYSIVASVIRERENTKKLSIRDVSKLNQEPNHQNQKDRMYSFGEDKYGSLDFLVMGKEYRYSERNISSILGSVEIKALYCDLDEEITKKIQFVEALKAFGKLLYTNGLEWRFYKYDPVKHQEELVWSEILGTYHFSGQKDKISDSDKVDWANIDKWYSLLKKLDKINWID